MWRVSATFLGVAMICLLEPWAGSQQVFTFKAASRLVLFTVVVDGPQGPVRSLRRDDFVVTDNGKQRTISVFQTNSEARRHAPKLAIAPRGEFSNSLSSAAASSPDPALILLDCLNSTFGSHACSLGKVGVANYLERLDPGQSVALWGLNAKGLAILSGFTSSKAQLLAALKKFQAEDSSANATPGDESVHGAAGGHLSGFAALIKQADEKYEFERHYSLASLTLASIRQIATHVAQIPGRLSLVWVTTHPCISGAKVAAALGNGRIAVYPIDPRGLLNRPPGTALVTVPESATTDALSSFVACSQWQGGPPGQANLRDIARQTGGVAYLNRNDLARGIRRAVAESKASYTLGFYVTAHALDHQFHRLQVHLTIAGLHAHYPHGYWARKNAAAASGLDPMAVAVRSPVDAGGIPLTARIVSLSDNRLTLRGTVGLGELAIRQSGGLHRGTLLFSLVGQDVRGATVRHRTVQVQLKLTNAQYARALRTGMRFHQTLTLAPGIVTVRVVVEDTRTGNVGSLIIPLGAKP